jgi:uncharacterized protein
MQYNVAQLLKGPIGSRRAYDLNEDVDRLDEELEVTRPLTGSLTFTRTNQGILVTGRLRTVLQASCRRCLEPAELPVQVDLEEEFYPTLQIGDVPLDRVSDDDEALLIDEHHILDLTEVIRQALWLVEPGQALCRLDCAGLCPRCGGNRNLGECQCEEAPVDPRWAALQSLLASESESPERSD